MIILVTGISFLFSQCQKLDHPPSFGDQVAAKWAPTGGVYVCHPRLRRSSITEASHGECSQADHPNVVRL